MRYFLGSIFIVAAAYLLLFNEELDFKFKSSPTPVNLTSSEVICKSLKSTISNHSDKSIFKYFNLSKEYKFSLHSSVAKSLFKNPSDCLPGKADGKLTTEVDVFDLPDENKPGIIFQFSFIDQETKNKVYEYGLNFYLEELNISQQAEK